MEVKQAVDRLVGELRMFDPGRVFLFSPNPLQRIFRRPEARLLHRYSNPFYWRNHEINEIAMTPELPLWRKLTVRRRYSHRLFYMRLSYLRPVTYSINAFSLVGWSCLLG